MDLALILFILMLLGLGLALMRGYPVAFTLAGVALLFGLLGIVISNLTGLPIGTLNFGTLSLFTERTYGIMTNEVLLAVPLFVAMGVMLEKSRVAEDLLETMGNLFGTLRGGLGISITIVGALLAASTGIVGATVVTMGLRPGLSLRFHCRLGHAWANNPALHCAGAAGRSALFLLPVGTKGHGDFLTGYGDSRGFVCRCVFARPWACCALYPLSGWGGVV